MSNLTPIILSLVALAALAFVVFVDWGPTSRSDSREVTRGEKFYCHLRSPEAAQADPLGEECVNELY